MTETIPPVRFPAPRFAASIAAYVTVCTVAVGQPMLQMYGGNVAVFVAANMQGAAVLWFGLAVLVLPPMLMTTLHVLAVPFGARITSAVHHALMFVGLWAVASVVFRSVSLGPWAVDMVMTAAIGLFLTVTYAKRRSVGNWVRLMSPLSAVVGILFVTSASGIINPPDASVVTLSSSTSVQGTTGTGVVVDPSDVSVVWIVLDEAPLWPIMGTDGTVNSDRFPGFAALAASSTWYRNVLGTSQTTTQAVPAMLTGKWPRVGSGPVLANYPRNLFTLMNGHIAMDAHEVVTALCPRKVCSKVSVSGGDHIANTGSDETVPTSTGTEEAVAEPSPTVDIGGFVNDAFVVLGHKILPKALREKLPPIDEGWGGFGQGTSESDLADQAESDEDDATPASDSPSSGTTVPPTLEPAKSTTVTEWEKSGPVSQVPVLRSVVHRAARASLPTLHFAHVLLPHRPWSLNANLTQSHPIGVPNANGNGIDRVRDQYQLFLMQYAAVDTLVGELVASLKRSDNWDRTMIVVTADHGLTFEPGHPKRKTLDVKAEGTLDDVYRVPLFIKYPGQTAPRIDDCTASSVDILPTVSAVTGISAGWTSDGADLRAACPTRPSRPVIWPKGSHRMTSGVADLMSRVRRYDSWVRADGDVDDIARTGRSADLVGKPVPTGASVRTDVEIELDNPEDFLNVGASPLMRSPVHVRGQVRSRVALPVDAEGLIVVDGVVAGVVSELGGLRKGESTSIRATILPSTLTPGRHVVSMYMVTGSGTQRRFSRLG